MRLDNRIQEKLNERKWYHRVTAITLVFSLLCAFFVPLDLVMPGVAAEGDESSEPQTTYYFETPANTIPSGAENFQNNIKKIEVTVGGVTYESPNGTDYTIHIDAGNADSSSLKFKLNYDYENDSELQAVIDSGYIYYTLPSDLKLQQSYWNVSCKVWDRKYSTTEPAGYYSIDQDTGLVLIRFTPNYISHLDTNRNGFTGDISFTANVNRNEDADGDKTVSIGTAGIQVEVQFNDSQVSASKDGVLMTAADSSKYVQWSITVDNPKGYVDMNGYSIEDVIKKNTNDTVPWSDIYDLQITPANSVTDNGDGTFSFNAVDGYPTNKYPEKVTISYKQKNIDTTDHTKYDNDAVIKKEGQTDIPIHKDITINNQLSLTKSGQPDYEIGDPGNQTKVKWHITVTDQLGNSLKDSQIIDTELNSDGLEVYYYDASGQKVNVTYSLGSGTLDITDDAAPSSLYVDYYTSLTFGSNETSKTVNNTASVISKKSVNPPTGSGEQTSPDVTYNRKTGVYKTGSFSNETMKFSWKATVYSNATVDAQGNPAVDENSKKSLDGYTIQDDKFIGKTFDEIKEYVTFNAFYRTNQGEESRTQFVSYDSYDSATGTITLKVDTAAEGYDPNKPPNKIEFFYTTEMTEDQKQIYEGNGGTETNTLTAKDQTGLTGIGTGTADYHSRVEASKVYESTDRIKTIGQADQTKRELKWKINLTKDAGFASDTMVVQDVLAAKDSNNQEIAGSHYITYQQAQSIELVGFQSKDNGAAGKTLASTQYELSFKGTDGNTYSLTDLVSAQMNATEFTVKFTGNINDEGFHYIDIEYPTTADTSMTTGYSTYTFTNGYEFGTATGSVDGLVYERKNPADVEYMTLNLQKNWADNNNAYSGRPKTVSVNVYRAEVTAEGEIPASNDSSWTLFKEYPQLSAESTASEQTFVLGTAEDHVFPQWNSQTGTRYCYRVEEILADGSAYTKTYNTESLIANKTSDKLVLTNTTTQEYGKRAVDKNGNPVTTITTSNLPQITIGDKKYYVFGWDLLMFSQQQMTYHDTLPTSDTIYITGKEEGLAAYEPEICYNNEGGAIEKLSIWKDCATVSQNGQDLTIQINNQTNLKFLRYYTAIPVESVHDGDTIINTVKRDNDTTGYTASVDVVKDSSPISDADVLEKKYLTGMPNALTYVLEVNPDKKKLSNEATYDITDTLTLAQATSDLKLSLYSIDVYRYDDNGVVNENDPLYKLKPNYIVSLNSTQNTELSLENAGVLSLAGYYGAKGVRVKDWSAGDTISFRVSDNGYSHAQIGYDDGTNAQWRGLDWTGSTGTYNFRVPEGTKNLYIVYFEGQSNVSGAEDISAEIVKTTPAILTVTVPDKEHLRIKYTYLVEGAAANEVVKFNNSASIHTDNVDAESSQTNSQVDTSDSSASAELKTLPQIFKVDVNNYGLNDLESTFRIAKYDATNGWVYASSITTIGEGEQRHRVITFPDAADATYHESGNRYPDAAAPLVFAQEDDSSTEEDDESFHDFALGSGLYKFVETVAPGDNYQQPDWTAGKTFADNKSFVYYYKYGDYSGTVPEGIKVNNVLANSTINIPNNQKITIKANKSFSGASDSIPDTAQVKLVLKWSPNKSGSVLYDITGNQNPDYDLEVPSGFNAERTITYDKTTNSCATDAEWIVLPSGKDGSPIYYFVQEVSYKEGDTEYSVADGKVNGFTPVYTGNGANTDGALIQVNNAQGIVVRKLWKDLNGNDITPPPETTGQGHMSIAFEVYGVNGSAKTKLPLENAVLNEGNHYEYPLPATIGEYQLSQFETFEVVEKLTDDQISALYRKYETDTTRKIKDGVGSLEIINTNITSSSTSASVQKVWRGDENDFTAVDVHLIQSENPLSAEQLKQIESKTLTTGFYTEENMRNGDEVLLVMNGKSRTVNMQEVRNAVITDSAVADATLSESVLTLTGKTVGSTELTITKSDNSTVTYTVSVIDPNATLNLANSWKANWEKLPYTYTKENGDEGNYHYYVIEDNVPNLPEGYSSSYRINGTATIITNAKESALTIQKVWKDADGNEITLDPNASGYNAQLADALPDTIQVQLYQRTATETVAGTGNGTKPTGLEVAALGDSITNGSYNGIADQYRYWNVLQSTLRSNGYTSAAVANNGVDQEEISNILKRAIGEGSDKNVDYSNLDVLCLLAGTNDVMHADRSGSIKKSDGTTISGKLENAPERFEYLCRQIFAKASEANRADFQLYVGTIPYITLLDRFEYPNNGCDQATAKQVVDTYNTAITNKVNTLKQEGYNITLVDVNSAVDVLDSNGNALDSATTMLEDGCHPNIAGYAAIANAFYNAINNSYTGTTAQTITNPTSVDMPSTQGDASKLFSGTPYDTYTLNKSPDGYQLEIKGLPEKSQDGKDYIYYVKEVGTHVLNTGSTAYTITGSPQIKGVTYTDNGQAAQVEETMYITNQLNTLDLAVTKRWAAEGTHDPVNVHIYRSTNKSDALEAMSGKKLIPSPLTLSESALTIYVGDPAATITANREDVTIGSYDTSKLEVVRSGTTISFNPRDATSSPITVTFTDGDGNQQTVTVTVVKPTFRFTLNQSTLTVGKTTASQVSVDHGELGTVTYSSSDTNVATVDSSGNVTAVAPGTATITATRGNDSVTQTITVTDKPTLSIETADTLTAGAEANFTVKLGDDVVSGYTVNVTQGSATVNGGKITATQAGTVEVKVTYVKDNETYTATKEITVNLPDTFHISADKTTLSVGSSVTATLSVPESTYGGTYSFEKVNGSANITLNGSTVSLTDAATDGDSAVFRVYRMDGEIKVLSADTVTITAQESSEPTWIEVTDSYADGGGKKLIEDATSLNTLTIKLISTTNDRIYVKLNDSWDAVNLDIDDDHASFKSEPRYEQNGSSKVSCSISGDTATLTFLDNVPYIELGTGDKKTNFKYYTTLKSNTTYSLPKPPTPQQPLTTTHARKILRAGALNQALSTMASDDSVDTIEKAIAVIPEMQVVYKAANVNASGSSANEFFVETLTINGNGWTTTTKLPAYDSTGHPYYYWAIEDEASAAGFDVSYLFHDSDPESERCINADGISQAEITVKNTKTDSDSTTLPETGGHGTKIYYTIGGLLLMLGAAGYVTIKRRRWLDG